jgi:ABC-type nitrate/sulfonate/bicarbonate transport system ATPase subunit
VFQDYSRSLLPWMDIHHNVTLPLKAARVPRAEREALARDALLSAAPTRVRKIITVDLPRPRDQIATKELPEFAHLRASVFALIKAESGSGPPSDAATPDG